MGFGALEEIHLQGHLLQVQADWSEHGDELAALEQQTEELEIAALPEGDRQARLGQLEAQRAQIVQHLREWPAHPGIAVSSSAAAGVAQRYRPMADAVDLAMGRYADLQSRPGATARTSDPALVQARLDARA